MDTKLRNLERLAKQEDPQAIEELSQIKDRMTTKVWVASRICDHCEFDCFGDSEQEAVSGTVGVFWQKEEAVSSILKDASAFEGIFILGFGETAQTFENKEKFLHGISSIDLTKFLELNLKETNPTVEHSRSSIYWSVWHEEVK